MPVLRDIVARLGMDFDGRGFKKADQSIKGIKGGLGNIVSAAAAAAAAIATVVGSVKLVGLASDAEETLNVLNASFGENTEAVKKWASNFADDVGRSEYTMRELAGTFGAVVNPMMGRNREVAAEMSMRFAELAVDLRSFYNLASDKAALDKLRAGITGESEPLKQLGVVMTEATLADYARREGIKKSDKQMSIAEKTTLRYNFILDQTKDAHGDALKTSLGWANATQALWGFLKDLGTTIGMYLLPAAERFVNWTKNIVRGLTHVVKNTHIVKAAMAVMGTAFLFWVNKMIAANMKLLISMAPLIIKFVLIAAVIAAAAIVVEDFLTFLDGGDSVIGRFIDKLFGPGSATEAANNLKDALGGLKLFIEQEIIPGWQSLGGVIEGIFGDIKTSYDKWVLATEKAMGAAIKWVKGFAKGVAEFFQPAIDKIKEFISYIASVGGKVLRFLKIDTDALKADFDEMANTIGKGADTIGGAIGGVGKAIGDAGKKIAKVPGETYDWLTAGQGGEAAGIRAMEARRKKQIKEIQKGIIQEAGGIKTDKSGLTTMPSRKEMEAATKRYLKKNPVAPQLQGDISRGLEKERKLHNTVKEQERLKQLREKILKGKIPKGKGKLSRTDERSIENYLRKPASKPTTIAPTFENTVNVEVKGDATEQTANVIGAVTEQANKRSNKRQLVALKQGYDG